jgi:plasmid stability protein
MPINLSIKNAPDDVVQRLRERAERHHRSLQGELMAIIEASVRDDRPATPAEILAEVRHLKLRTPSEAAAIVRADRDGR